MRAGSSADTRWQVAARAELRRLKDWLDQLEAEQHELREGERAGTLAADEQRRLQDLRQEVEAVRALLGRAAARLPARGSS